MTLTPKKMREVVFQMLFSLDMGYTELSSVTDLLMKELEISKKNLKIAEMRTEEIMRKIDLIDAEIAKTSQSYDFHRIQRAEKNILRQGVFEILYDEKIPPKVAIAEAIRLARKFSTPESADFVNAILDAIHQASQGQEVDQTVISQAVKSLKKSEEAVKDAHTHVNHHSL